MAHNSLSIPCEPGSRLVFGMAQNLELLRYAGRTARSASGLKGCSSIRTKCNSSRTARLLLALVDGRGACPAQVSSGPQRRTPGSGKAHASPRPARRCGRTSSRRSASVSSASSSKRCRSTTPSAAVQERPRLVPWEEIERSTVLLRRWPKASKLPTLLQLCSTIIVQAEFCYRLNR